jgi:hypothetical protein
MDAMLARQQRNEKAAMTERVRAVLAADEMDHAALAELAARRVYPAAVTEFARVALAVNTRSARASSLVLHLVEPYLDRSTRLHRLTVAFGAAADTMIGRGYFDETKLRRNAGQGRVVARCVYAAIGEPLAAWNKESRARVKAALALRELVLIFQGRAS